MYWKEFGTTLPEILRGYALASAGKPEDAVRVWRSFVQSEMTSMTCPSEHPMYSSRRVSRMSTGISCIEAVEPKAELSSLRALLNQAKRCVETNAAVG